ncbi:MAG: hypothetical protein A2W47_07010 [Gammaproteobacteria bacterium RIFCSPHIGHO2_12_38_15]|nr:MAG: hypothetical protein A2W47_07010 [Gammaproteobacteria bacterium RIFCSPHIGHO2_12_38_15]
MHKTLLSLPLFLFLSACILLKDNETYNHDEVCAGLKRQMIFNTVNSNITGESLRYPNSRLKELYLENNCQ